MASHSFADFWDTYINIVMCNSWHLCPFRISNTILQISNLIPEEFQWLAQSHIYNQQLSWYTTQILRWLSWCSFTLYELILVVRMTKGLIDPHKRTRMNTHKEDLFLYELHTYTYPTNPGRIGRYKSQVQRVDIGWDTTSRNPEQLVEWLKW